MGKCIKKCGWIIALLFLTTSCFEYNANQILLDDDQKDLTAKNLKKIFENPAPDRLRIVLVGDTQRFYDEVADFVASVNQLEDIDFIVHAGDISDFGLDHEFKWVHEIMEDLRFPYLTVIGNHDLLANGRKVYSRMYGPLDYSFKYGAFKFIMLNTNSREFNFNGNVPDLNWLKNTLQEGGEKATIIISHIPPFDDDFDDDLELQYAQLLAENQGLTVSLHGHQHNFKDTVYYNDGIRYFTTTTVGKKGYALIELSPEDVKITRIEY